MSVLLDTSYLGWGVFKIVVGLPFCWWYVPDRFEEPAVVEPVHIFEGGVLALVTASPRRPLVDKFCLVEADDGFGEGVELLCQIRDCGGCG